MSEDKPADSSGFGAHVPECSSKIQCSACGAVPQSGSLAAREEASQGSVLREGLLGVVMARAAARSLSTGCATLVYREPGRSMAGGGTGRGALICASALWMVASRRSRSAWFQASYCA